VVITGDDMLAGIIGNQWRFYVSRYNLGTS